jgi:hypothetical protein
VERSSRGLFKVLYAILIFSCRIEENHDKYPSSLTWSWESNPCPPECQVGVVTAWPRRMILRTQRMSRYRVKKSGFSYKYTDASERRSESLYIYIYIYTYLFIINCNWAHARWQWVQADIHPQVKAHTSHKSAHTYKNSTRHNTSKMTLPSKYSDNLRKHRRNSNTEYTPSSTEYTLSRNIPSHIQSVLVVRCTPTESQCHRYIFAFILVKRLL